MKILFFIVFCELFIVSSIAFRCDRRPYGSQAQVSPSDGRFKLTVLEAEDNAYIPDQLYIVQITATDDASHFTGFMISAEGDSQVDPHNPRKAIALSPGELRPASTAVAKFSERCPYSVEQAMSSIKATAEVYWSAPPSGNGCVTLRAMVQENDESWFEDGAPLTQRLCEDMRQPDDVAPQLNYDCNICDEAKYQVSFTGIWSRNTHPRLYPENDWVPKYSDLVGASHSAELLLWTPGSLASEGLKELAENSNTTKFEEEIRDKIGDGVRTMIKGKGHGYRQMTQPTNAYFRADKESHLLTVAVGVHPSPDWFLGVTRFELCQGEEWLPERELNLYPWDAGTDSGVSYESMNLPTVPADAISRVEMSTYDKKSPFFEMDMKNMHPFGKLHITLIRTYHRDCEETTEAPTDGQEGSPDENQGGEETPNEGEDGKDENPDNNDDKPEPKEPSRYRNPELASGYSTGISTTEAVAPAPEPSEPCPMSPWSGWSPCEGSCEDDRVRGYRWRERFHLVDGVAVEKYDPHARRTHRKEVSKYCKQHVEDFERSECEDECPDQHTSEEIAERRLGARPGYKFYLF